MTTPDPETRVLVTGWFSFDDAEVTAGDLLARDTVCRWLADAHVPYDTAVGTTFQRGGDLHLATVQPALFTHLVFVCGPAAGEPVERLFSRFGHARRIAVGVSVVSDTGRLGMHQVIARDGAGRAAPDLSLDRQPAAVPVVGVVRSHAQPEYGDRHRVDEAHAAVDRLLMGSDVAPVNLDTWLHPGRPDVCSTPAQVHASLARMDAVVTTRLHGLALSLQAGVPALAVDPVAGGGKVSAQAQALDWPAVCEVSKLADRRLQELLAWCLSDEARRLARERPVTIRPQLDAVRADLLAGLTKGHG